MLYTAREGRTILGIIKKKIAYIDTEYVWEAFDYVC